MPRPAQPPGGGRPARRPHHRLEASLPEGRQGARDPVVRRRDHPLARGERGLHAPPAQRRPADGPHHARPGRAAEDGKPPFTWEQSAIDALRGRGLASGRTGARPARSSSSRATTASATATTIRTCRRRTCGASRTTTRAGSTSPTGASRRRPSRSSAARPCLLKRLAATNRRTAQPGPRDHAARQSARHRPGRARGTEAAGEEPVRLLRRRQARRRVRRADRRRCAAGEVGARLPGQRARHAPSARS